MVNIPFSPPPGLFTDDTSFSAEGRWVDGSNVRFWNGKPQPIGGWLRRISTQVSGTYKSGILEWNSNAGTAYVAYGPPASLKVETGGVLYDITPSGSFSTAQWVFANWGEQLLANESGQKLYIWALNTGVAATEITQSPDNITCILASPTRRQIIALGCNEEGSGTFNGRCIRWCDFEDYTDWTSSQTNNAGEQILDGGTSGIVAAKWIGEFIGVWTSTEMFLGTYLGDPGQTYRFERVGENCGAIGRRSVQVVDGTAYWLAPDLQFHIFTPGSQPAPLPCTVIDKLRTDIATASKVDTFASYVAKFNEIWWTYPKTGGGAYVGSYVAFSLTGNTWFRGETKRRAMHQGLTNVIAVDNGGNLINCETGQFGSSLTNGTLDWTITSGDFNLNEAQDRFMLLSVMADFKSQAGNVTLTIGAREYPQGTESTTSLTLTTSTTKSDFRKSGRLVRITIAGSDGPGFDTATFARLGKLEFKTVKLGQR